MPLLEHGHLVEDRWVAVADDAAVPDGVPALVSFPRLESLAGRTGPLGVVVDTATRPEDLAHYLSPSCFPLPPTSGGEGWVRGELPPAPSSSGRTERTDTPTSPQPSPPASAGGEGEARTFPSLSLVAIRFPKFRDGRGFTLARTLRERYGFTGEIRALGHVLPDQHLFLLRCGFSSVAVPDDADLAVWTAAIGRFHVAYQPALAEKAPLSLLRRRLGGG